ncbi:MAG: GAF domain-containing protein, partial [Bacteroidota bacterium]
MATRIEEATTIQEERPPVTLDLGYFPFPVQLNLKPLIDNWRKSAASERFFYNAFADRIEATLAEHPFLLEPIEDLARLEGFDEFLELLFAPTFPCRGWTSTLLVACSPFMISQVVVATPAFKALFGEEGVTFELLDASLHREMPNCRTLTGYQAILKKYYDFNIPVDEPILTSFINQKTGLCRYYKISGSAQFIEVKNLAPLPRLAKNVLQGLLDKPFNFKELERMLPPENFLFSGVMLGTLTPVTVEESLSRLQHGLLEKRNTDCGELGCLELEIRNFFRQSRIRLGLATLQRNGELNFNSPKPLWNSLLLRQFPEANQEWVKGSIYEKALKTGQPLLVEDLEKRTVDLGRAEQAILDAGYRNILLTPLDYEGQQVGILELASAEPGDLHGLSLIKIAQLKPIFGCALHRHLEEFENKVEAVMLERYTAIHPAIQWRFREAAIRASDVKSSGQEEEILFEKVSPFYGSLDIRESSAKRNQAIVRDLLDNLETGRNVLLHGYETLSFSILGELVFETERRLNKLQSCFCTGDEVALTEFIRKEINPVVEHLRQHYPALSGAAQVYQNLVNPETGIFYRNRLAYEEALRILNQTIVECLDEEETALQ